MPMWLSSRSPFGLFCIAGLFLSLYACGYRLQGQDAGIPAEVRSIVVPPFINRTRVVGLDWELTTAVRNQLRQRGRVRVVEEIGEADAILTGIVRRFNSRVVALNEFAEVLQFENDLRVEVTLRRREPSQILWPKQIVRVRDVYDGARGAVVTTSSDFVRGALNPNDIPQFTDAQLTETMQQKAREQIVERFARELQEKVAEGF